MAPITRGSSSRASSVAGSTTNVSDDHRRNEQPADSVRRQSTSTTTSKRPQTRPFSGGDGSAPATCRELQSMGGSERSARSPSFQKGDHQRQSLPPSTLQNDGLQVFNEQNEPMESSDLGLEYLRDKEEGQASNSRTPTDPKSEKRRQASATPDHDSRGAYPSVAQGGRDSSEELDLTVLPLDRELINPMFHHLKLYLDPIVLNNDKLLNEIRTIESLVKTSNPVRKIKSVQKAIMNLVANINDQVKVLNQIGGMVQKLSENDKDSQGELQKWVNQDATPRAISVTPATITHDPPPHMRETKEHSMHEQHEREPSPRRADTMLHQRTSADNEEIWSPQIETRGQETKGKAREVTVFGEVVRRTTIGREKLMNKPNQEWKTQATSGSNTATKPTAVKATVTRVPGKCDTCGSTEGGHDFRACRRKSKGINMLEEEVDPDPCSPTEEELELIFHDDNDSLCDNGDYRAVQEESSYTADISNLEETFQVLDISCLEETTINRPVFIDRRNVVKKLGSPFLITMCNSWKLNMLIDTDFVVILDANHVEVILGANMMHLYGMSIAYNDNIELRIHGTDSDLDIAHLQALAEIPQHWHNGLKGTQLLLS
ncbi:uncharacterized protein MELLADRAFT_112479 [Melampsora larici-populina 98AG31]|uniref:Uncharacterized protein n=1 Tax=Melampsora larici-populina (strain 98AG31 / pathotype 3-4-7) TaxID=747676 RepID=F4S6L8_MELLP|nr:uncharacterized protein MELLADRAFT_112479 [Melampsora larici-populina 98AG31]EGF99737.1 hypothetical protein MELLADRAFT_112479 [Melampsora larici-populina 98AG31]